MIDIIDQIDDVTATVCGWCSAKLTPDSHSGDFCSETHQANWQAHQAGLPAPFSAPGAGVVVYDVAIDMSRFDDAAAGARESLERFHRAFEVAGRRLGRMAGIPVGWLSGHWEYFGITDAGVQHQPADQPTDVPTREQRMQAALDARRNRNTGPQRRPRAPKNLGGRTRR